MLGATRWNSNLSADALNTKTNIPYTACKPTAWSLGFAAEGSCDEVGPYFGRASSRDFRESHLLLEAWMSQPVPSISIARLAGMPPPGFRSALSYDGSASAWLRVAGELDLAAAPELEQSLRDAVVRARLLVLDLRDLTFIDSSGVHGIVDGCVRARPAPCRVVVIHGPPQVQRVFALTGLDRLIETVTDPAEINRDPTGWL